MEKQSFSLLLLHLFALLSFVTGEIKTLTITSDSRPMILFEKFGFTHGGHVNISVSSVSVSTSLSSPPDPSRLGFFLLSEESFLQVYLEIQQNPSFCVLDSHYVLLLFSFRDLSPPPHASLSKAYPVTSPNEYSLLFANCAPETRVSMDVRTELFNFDGDGTKDYLSTGLNQLHALFFIFSLLYLGFISMYIYIVHLLVFACLHIRWNGINCRYQLALRRRGVTREGEKRRCRLLRGFFFPLQKVFN